MAPGLTSPGGRLPNDPEDDDARYGRMDEDGDVMEGEEAELEAGEVVVIEAEGKDTACMVGVLKVGTKEMKKTKKGQACEAGHYLGDGLWQLNLG